MQKTFLPYCLRKGNYRLRNFAHMKDVWVADGVLANYQESLPGELNYLQATYENSAALALHYEPKAYHGRIVLFKVEDKDMKFTTPLPAFAQQELHALANSPLNGWDLAIHASIETVIIPGSHQELLEPHYAKTTAEKMRAVLETLK